MTHAVPPEDLYGETFAAGAVIGAYVVEERTSGGGFASVYRAHHVDTGDLAAIKVLHRSLAESVRMLQRFEREARALNRLRHPHIVEIFAVGELSDGRPYIAMEWLPGRTLAEELRARGPLSAGELVATMDEIGSAVAAAHALGVIHRDLKGQNIMALPRDSWFTTKLVDFGLAKLIAPEDADASLTNQTVLGTPQSMAPEQILGGPVDARTDIYALGVLAFELATGRPPFTATEIIELEQLHLHAPPPRASELAPVPDAFDRVIERALAKNPAARHASVHAFVTELRAALDAAPEPGPAATPPRTHQAPGIAVLVEAHVHDHAQGAVSMDEAAEEVIEQLEQTIEQVIGHAAALAEEAGLALVTESANALVAAAFLGREDAALRQRAVDMARAVARYAHDQGHPEVTWLIAIHAGPAELGPGPTGDVPAGGDLLRLGTWPQRALLQDGTGAPVRALISAHALAGLAFLPGARLATEPGVEPAVYELIS